MNKLTLSIILLIIQIFTISAQPGGSIWEIDEHPNVLREIDGECILLKLDLGKELIVRNCPEYDYYEFDSDRSFGFHIEPVCLTDNCNMDISLYFNDLLIYETTAKGSGNELNIPIDYLYLESLLGPSFSGPEAHLRLEFVKKCYTVLNGNHPTLIVHDPVIETFPIQIRNKGDKYISEIITDDYSIPFCEELYDNDKEKIREIDLCCQGSLSIDLNISRVTGTNISVSGSVSKSESTGVLGATIGINYSISQYRIAQTVQSFGINYSMSAEGDRCIFPGLLLRILKHEKCLFEINCDGPDTKDHLIEEFEEVIEVSTYICGYVYDCPDKDPKPRFISEPLEIAHNDCISNITLSLTDPAPDMSYEFLWTGPDGTIYIGEDLFGVPFGKYELTILDECCNEYKYTFNLCDQILYGDWYYAGGQYCREVVCSCDDISTFRQELQYLMCVDPHRFDENWNYDPEKQKCVRHAYWTGQDGIEIDLSQLVHEKDIETGDGKVVRDPALIREYFDEDLQMCIREILCEEGSPGIQLEEIEAEFGEWVYDPFWDICYRQVLCFGEKAFNSAGSEIEDDLTDPTFGEWNYDEFWENCYRLVYCGGEQAIDEWGVEVIGETEEVEIEWTVENDWNFECVGKIYCESEELPDELIESPDANWYYNPDTDQCVTNFLQCAGEDQDDYNENPEEYGDWEFNETLEICTREVYCETADEYFDHEVDVYYTHDPFNHAGCDIQDGYESYLLWCGEFEPLDEYICLDYVPDNMIPRVEEDMVQRQVPFRQEKNNNDFQFYKMIFYSSDGKKIMEFKTENAYQIYDLIKQARIKNQLEKALIFYSVFGEEQFLFSGKINTLNK